MGGVPRYDCVIVGGGPGGLLAALSLLRFGRSVAIVQTGLPRASWIPRTHPLIGYDRGISGPRLLRRLHRQLARHGGVSWHRDFGRVDRARGRRGFTIALSHGGRLRARTVILATGIEDVHPMLANLHDLRRRGLLRYFSIGDGWEHRQARLAVLARDDAGLQRALFLSRWSRRLDVIVPLGFRPAPSRRRELRRLPLVRLHPCATLTLEPLARSRGLRVSVDGGRPWTVRATYVELGSHVRDGAFAHLRGLRRTREGHLITTTEQRTSIPGLFAVGDCVNPRGQLVVAAGQAAVAATAIHNELPR